MDMTTPAAPRDLAALRERLGVTSIPRRKDTFTLATWNIREFGKTPRKDRSIAIIAEVLRAFDLTAIIELRDNLGDLRRTLALLPHHEAIFSEAVLDQGGNRERIAYLFDRRRITFTGLASHITPPREKKGGEYVPPVSWWRPPYAASFRARHVDFVLVAAHVRYGLRVSDRAIELALLADWAKRYALSPNAVDRDLVLLGDFNIPSLKSSLFDAVTQTGFEMPKCLEGVHGTNLAANKRYDQLLVLPGGETRFTGTGGALNFVARGKSGLIRVPKERFTFEVSDHLPLWAELAA